MIHIRPPVRGDGEKRREISGCLWDLVRAASDGRQGVALDAVSRPREYGTDCTVGYTGKQCPRESGKGPAASGAVISMLLFPMETDII